MGVTTLMPLNRGGVEAHVNGDQDAVIQDRTGSGDGGSAQSTGKVIPQPLGGLRGNWHFVKTAFCHLHP